MLILLKLNWLLVKIYQKEIRLRNPFKKKMPKFQSKNLKNLKKQGLTRPIHSNLRKWWQDQQYHKVQKQMIKYWR